MSSLPPQASPRRSTEGAANSPPETVAQPPTHAESSVIEPSRVAGVTDSSAIQAQQSPEPPNEEVQTCWICQQDSTEDAPGTEWRRPCPCSLTAHDSCLLEWIVSEEAPRRGELGTRRKIVCPQCHAEIQIQRPTDYLVLATESVQQVAELLILPTALSSLAACFYSGFLMYGINTVQMVFGREEAYRILALGGTRNILGVNQIQSEHTNTAMQMVSRVLRRVSMNFDPFLPATDWLAHWKLFVGLPLIAPTLMLSRTTIVDPIFTITPVTYLLFRPTSYLHLQDWPPSPSAVIAILPYVRAFYNELYRYSFAGLEKKWDAAVQRQPQDGEVAEDLVQAQDEQDEFEMRLEFFNDDEPEAVAQEVQRNQAPGPAAAPAPANPQPEQDQQGNAGALPAHADPQNPAGGNGHHINIRRNISTSALATSIMGALFFPSISSAMGEVLKVTLPKHWVTKKGLRLGATGLLQEKWGRSIVGGCLFVVLKDALLLYCKWKKARDSGEKRILDYTGKRRGERSPVAD